MRASWNTWILSLLTATTAVLAVIITWNGGTTWLEGVSCVTGAVCVWLTVKESAWNFPISLLNVSTFSVVYFRAHLYADASLQVIYFVLTIIGWYLWLYGGERKTALRTARTKMLEWAGVLFAVAAITGLYWEILTRIGGSVTFWDAMTTALSLGAQWLLNRKRLENWIFWIAADVIYIPLYVYKGLYLTAVLYAVFLVMATMGLLQWRATWRRQKRDSVDALPLAEATT